MTTISLAALPQPSLFGAGEPNFDSDLSEVQHRPLAAGAWVAYQPTWLEGHESLFAELAHTARWNTRHRRMYDRTVVVPRLIAAAPQTGAGAEILQRMSATLSKHYGVTLNSISLAWYRDGRDSVAPHADRIGRRLRNTVVATVSLGAPRRFTMRAVDVPADGAGSLSFSLGWGDLLVMGGTCQRTWLHGVPKVAQAAPRLSIMFREASADET